MVLHKDSNSNFSSDSIIEKTQNMEWDLNYTFKNQLFIPKSKIIPGQSLQLSNPPLLS